MVLAPVTGGKDGCPCMLAGGATLPRQARPGFWGTGWGTRAWTGAVRSGLARRPHRTVHPAVSGSICLELQSLQTPARYPFARREGLRPREGPPGGRGLLCREERLWAVPAREGGRSSRIRRVAARECVALAAGAVSPHVGAALCVAAPAGQSRGRGSLLLCAPAAQHCAHQSAAVLSADERPGARCAHSGALQVLRAQLSGPFRAVVSAHRAHPRDGADRGCPLFRGARRQGADDPAGPALPGHGCRRLAPEHRSHHVHHVRQPEEQGVQRGDAQGAGPLQRRHRAVTAGRVARSHPQAARGGALLFSARHGPGGARFGVRALFRREGGDGDVGGAPGADDPREGGALRDADDRHGLSHTLLSGLGWLSGRRSGGGHAADERVHRGAGAGGTGTVSVDAQALQDPAAGRA